MDKEFTVDFEHDNEYAKVSFSGIWAKIAEDAIEIARKKLAKPGEWRCIGLDRVSQNVGTN